MTDRCRTDLVQRARAGDALAWRALVDRYKDMIWRIARVHGLSDADAADVSQFTWLSLARHLHDLRQPEAVGGWLATVARRETLRLLSIRAQESTVEQWDTRESAEPGPEQLALLEDRDHTLWSALRALPDRCRTLLTLFAVSPELSYTQLSAAAGIRAGSVGPDRGRCLALLRRRLSGFGMTGRAEDVG